MKPEQRREQILRAATRVFAAKGYHGASVTDIINAAGIARGTFYLYFEGKREIFSELVDVLLARLLNCMKRVDLSAGSPPWVDQIKANVMRISNVLYEEQELTLILYNHAMGLDEDFDKKIREFYDSIHARTEGAFKLGQDMGLVRREVDPRLAAYHLVGSLKEVMYHMARRDIRMSIEKVVGELMSYSTQGMLPGEKLAAKNKSGTEKRRPGKKGA